MHMTKLRKVGGSIMLAVPPALLDTLGLSADRLVGLDVVNGELVVRPARPRYTLDELLSQTDPDASATDEDRAWLDDGPAGREQI